MPSRPLPQSSKAANAIPQGKRRWLWLLAASLLLLLAASLLLLLPLSYFYGGQILRIATNQGQIVLEVDDPNTEVLVKDYGVVIQDGTGRREITMTAGTTHELEVTIKDAAGETRLPTKRLTLSRGGREVLNVRQELALAKKPEPKKTDPQPDSKMPDPEPNEPEPAQPAALPPTVVIDLGGGVKMEFVLIDPKTKPDGGKFKMGSPPEEKWRNPLEKAFDAEKQHEVEITKPFYLAKYPVTQEQYAKLAGDNPSWLRKGGIAKDRLTDVPKEDTSRFPVEYVSWYEADTFCTEKMQPFRTQMPAVLRRQNYRFALPTEAQWEYACRAGTTTPFSFGSILDGKQANCNGNAPYGTDEKGPSKERTTKVGAYGENPWGLCDMHGNVYQWCADYYGPNDEGLTKADPLRAVRYSEEHRVLRGGSWHSNARYCRAAYRSSPAPANRNNVVGFRVAFRLD